MWMSVKLCVHKRQHIIVTFYTIITFKVTDSAVFPSKYGHYQMCELCGLPESSTGDTQVILVLGIQAHGDDDFVPSFSIKLLFVAYFQLKTPKALVVIKIQL